MAAKNLATNVLFFPVSWHWMIWVVWFWNLVFAWELVDPMQQWLVLLEYPAVPSILFYFLEPVCYLSLREPGQPWKPALTGSLFQLIWPCNLNFLDLHTEPSSSITISVGFPLHGSLGVAQIQQ